MSKKAKKIAKQVNSGSRSLMRSVMRSGANNIGNALMEAVTEANGPSDIVFGRIMTAVRSGAIATGSEVVRERLSRL
ncbi:hypothetical protein [Paenibacillus soyae]|uniref:Uncharacterized protein n=1 Tax=Paenibacillus soyae TaxID=2969249 RepID=A0A9X2MX72_9BACL|nr:hypothetical protein [Paenibacillus soyae]MCR2808007.1 hypothetical protein [Paenibacillus soyae]